MELEKLPEAVSEFNDALRVSFVEYVTVGSRCYALCRSASACSSPCAVRYTFEHYGLGEFWALRSNQG